MVLPAITKYHLTFVNICILFMLEGNKLALTMKSVFSVLFVRNSDSKWIDGVSPHPKKVCVSYSWFSLEMWTHRSVRYLNTKRYYMYLLHWRPESSNIYLCASVCTSCDLWSFLPAAFPVQFPTAIPSESELFELIEKHTNPKHTHKTILHSARNHF